MPLFRNVPFCHNRRNIPVRAFFAFFTLRKRNVIMNLSARAFGWQTQTTYFNFVFHFYTSPFPYQFVSPSALTTATASAFPGTGKRPACACALDLNTGKCGADHNHGCRWSYYTCPLSFTACKSSSELSFFSSSALLLIAFFQNGIWAGRLHLPEFSLPCCLPVSI